MSENLVEVVEPVQLTPEEMLQDYQKYEINNGWAIMDPEGTGSIPAKDLNRTMRMLGIHKLPVDIQKILDEYDPEKTGLITFETFTSIMAKQYSELDFNEEVMEAFRVFDFYDTGKIGSYELRKIMGGMGNKLSPKELKVFMKLSTPNKDNEIIWDEYLLTMQIE